MAANRYLLASATDWSNAASWHDGVYGASAVPVDTDAVYIREGSQTVSSGLAQTGIDLGACYITAGFTGTIGSTGTSLTISCDTTAPTTFEYGAGAGKLYLCAGTGTIVTFRANGRGHAYLTGGTFTTIEVFSGEVDINDQVDLSTSTVRVFGGTVTIDWKSDATPPTIEVYGGTVYLRRPATTIDMANGIVQYQNEKSVTATTTINLRGGLFDLRSGPVTTLNGYSGRYTAGMAIQPITVGTSNVWNTEADALQGRAATITYTTVNRKGAADSWR